VIRKYGIDMNTVFALMIITSTGVMEAPNAFKTEQACLAVQKQLVNTQSYCVAKENVTPEQAFAKMSVMMKNMMKEMEK
jgi:hypothetical protein